MAALPARKAPLGSPPRVSDRYVAYTDPSALAANANIPAAANDNLPKQQLTLASGVMMCIVAGAFDALQAGTGIFALAGSLGTAAVGWIPILGQILGGALLSAGIALQWSFGILIMAMGYLTMSLWFLMKGIPILSGKRAALRAGVFIATLITAFLPLLGLLPDLSVWVATMVLITFAEDKANAKSSELRYNERNSRRVRRRYVQENQ